MACNLQPTVNKVVDFGIFQRSKNDYLMENFPHTSESMINAQCRIYLKVARNWLFDNYLNNTSDVHINSRPSISAFIAFPLLPSCICLELNQQRIKSGKKESREWVGNVWIMYFVFPSPPPTHVVERFFSSKRSSPWTRCPLVIKIDIRVVDDIDTHTKMCSQVLQGIFSWLEQMGLLDLDWVQVKFFQWRALVRFLVDLRTFYLCLDFVFW